MNKRIIALSNYPFITGFFLIVALSLLLTACNSGKKREAATEQKNPKCKVEKSFFGMTTEGDTAMLYTLTNEKDITVSITNYGGIITEIRTPDRDGRTNNIVLNLDRLEQYLEGHPNFGNIVGRYGNRIAKASFVLDDETYVLAANNGQNSLHGGWEGFDKKLWDDRC